MFNEAPLKVNESTAVGSLLPAAGGETEDEELVRETVWRGGGGGEMNTNTQGFNIWEDFVDYFRLLVPPGLMSRFKNTNNTSSCCRPDQEPGAGFRSRTGFGLLAG